jgi:hypothetical protein
MVRDSDLEVAYFMHLHPSWKPEDFGYPPADYVLFDLMRMIDNRKAIAQNAASRRG